MLNKITPQTLAQEPVTAAQVSWLLQHAALEPAHSAKAWPLLEAAHIVGQTQWITHRRVHQHMLARAWKENKWIEVGAQLLRLVLTPLGHVMGCLPLGNPGSSRAGVFADMPVPTHLHALIAQSRVFIESST